MEMCHKESTVQNVDVTDCLKSCSWNFLKESKLLYSLRSAGAAGCFRLQLAACWLRLAAFGCCSAASNWAAEDSWRFKVWFQGQASTIWGLERLPEPGFYLITEADNADSIFLLICLIRFMLCRYPVSHSFVYWKFLVVYAQSSLFIRRLCSVVHSLLNTLF